LLIITRWRTGLSDCNHRTKGPLLTPSEAPPRKVSGIRISSGHEQGLDPAGPTCDPSRPAAGPVQGRVTTAPVPTVGEPHRAWTEGASMFAGRCTTLPSCVRASCWVTRWSHFGTN